jgi:protein ImuB
VVVDRDKPQGVILWANEHARRYRVLPGMRYAAGLSLASTLHAGEVSAGEVRESVDLLTERLRGFSSDVEPGADEPGVFWVDATGLGRLYESLQAWAHRLRSDLKAFGFQSRIAVGFTRFGTYAAAKAGIGRGIAVFAAPAEEKSTVQPIPLKCLGIDPELRNDLGKLGVRTVGAFLKLPAGGIRQRFGLEAHHLHRLASGRAWAPLAPSPARQPLLEKVDLDQPEADIYRLLFTVKRLLHPLLETLTSRHEALTELRVLLRLDGVGDRTERIRPAAPTLDVRQIMNLVHLRLESVDLGAGVEELQLTAESVPIERGQLSLFADQPRRDLGAADRALARIRAELGDNAVVRARLREGHLPEARFGWEVLEHVALPKPRDVWVRPLVRRVLVRPHPLAPRARSEPDGWLLRGDEYGPVREMTGPYILSGGWWRRPIHREYHFAQMRDGEVVWIYYDRNRRQWFLQGTVE